MGVVHLAHAAHELAHAVVGAALGHGEDADSLAWRRLLRRSCCRYNNIRRHPKPAHFPNEEHSMEPHPPRAGAHSLTSAPPPVPSPLPCKPGWTRNRRSPSAGRGPGAGVSRPDQVAGRSGLELMQAMLRGELPPIARTLDFMLISVGEGNGFQGRPGANHLNPMGTCSGWFATLLDSALGCVLHAAGPGLHHGRAGREPGQGPDPARAACARPRAACGRQLAGRGALADGARPRHYLPGLRHRLR